MRILEVRFKNLNSLAGEWCIDFTNPAYSADGIFAITGPTGAGKTTILDAICLALYGRTPRLDKINKNVNEIMSRHTGECFAEVSFQTSLGSYRCHWSQHRARRKSGGELQIPHHEIVNADTGQVLESKIRDVALLIENVTGMDFGRFTRSMLLAQGGFAAFLEAQPDERAPILEQITGTEIYSEISMKVHQRRGEERQKLEKLQADIADISILGQEEVKELSLLLQEKQQQESGLSKKVETLSQALAWQEGITNLQKEIVLLEGKWRGFQERLQKWEPELITLNRAHKALTMEGEYQKVVALRLQQQQELKQLQEAEPTVAIRETSVRTAFEFYQAMAEKLEATRTRQKNEAEQIKIVREIDLRMADKSCELDKVKENQVLADKQLSTCKKNIEDLKKQLQESYDNLQNTENYLEKNARDAGLVERLAVISQLFNALQEKDENYKDIQEQLESVSTVRDSLKNSYQELAAAHENSGKAVINTEQEHQQIVENIKLLLKGYELNQWREKLEVQKERENLLKDSLENLKTISISQQELKNLREQKELLNKGKSQTANEIEYQIEKKGYWEKENGHLEKELSLLNRIHSLEEERKKLKDGEVCPLCGATQHPFAEGNLPLPEESEIALKQARAQLQLINDLLLQLQLKQVELHKDIEQVQLDIKKQEDTLGSAKKQCIQLLDHLNLEFEGAESKDKVEAELTATRIKIKQYCELIDKVEEQEKLEKNTRRAADEARGIYNDLEKSLQEALYDQRTVEHEYNGLLKELAAGEKQLARVRYQTLQEVEQYGISELPQDSLGPILESLEQRRNYWQKAQIDKTGQEKKIAELKIEWGKQETLLTKMEEQVLNWHQEYEALLRDYNKLKRQRLELYGDKDPDAEEKRLQEEMEEAEKNLENARQEQIRVEQELSNLQAKIASLSDSIKKRSQELNLREEELKVRLVKVGFADEADYLSASLSEEEREQLEKEAELLRREESELKTRLEDRKSSLESERDKMLSDKSHEELQVELNTAKLNHNNIQQEIYALKHNLSENEKRQVEKQEQLKNIASQQKECERWEVLHELIGSADGKKYRNFAQGLTFEIVVHHANQQLSKMSDRYLLIRDDTQLLNLNVIDNYQGGEIRSTRNLSGGESFIVSLALALGLSRMASHNVNIDSLFLDEGFGTLDEDTLDNALETLSGLQQEGKMIGIISHVPALKERISTQIEVIPKSGGYSKLSGPGCKEIG
jgi:exonuclease SbcC